MHAGYGISRIVPANGFLQLDALHSEPAGRVLLALQFLGDQQSEWFPEFDQSISIFDQSISIYDQHPNPVWAEHIRGPDSNDSAAA